MIEYYFSKQISLESIREEMKDLKVKFYKKEKCATLTDKYGNTLFAYGVKNKNDKVSFFAGIKTDGAHFIAHDLIMHYNALMITGNSYLELCDEMEKVGQAQMRFGDALSLPFIRKDLADHDVELILNNNKYRLKSKISEAGLERKRERFQKRRAQKILEEQKRDEMTLFKQIDKMNKTNTVLTDLVELKYSQMAIAKQ